MKYSARQAAAIVGKSTPTITRAIKRGDLGATKLEGGGYEIDAAELHRVWPPVTADPVYSSEVSILKTKLETQEFLLEQVKSQLADAMNQRDAWHRVAKAQMDLLETKLVEQPLES